MKTINLNKQIGVKLLLYPDNQPHVQILLDDLQITEGAFVRVVCSLTDSIKVLQLLECSNALDNLFAVKKELVIPYLMGARFDRLMQHGDSVDLKVIADLVNMCGFQKVYLCDVHSDTATLLIRNAINCNNSFLVQQPLPLETILICPDAGASKKVHKYFEWNENIVDVVYCNKSRDLTNGFISLTVLQPEKCKNRNCVIIDDLCDGGGTFLAIAEQIEPAWLKLIVTHGIFSKGFHSLKQRFDEILVSNSYQEAYDSNIVRVKEFFYSTSIH